MKNGVSLEIDNGLFVARRIDDRLLWAEGQIGAGADQSNTAQTELMLTTLDNIVRVPSKEQMATNCTDGREPTNLESGEPMPVRPQVAGCALGIGHYMLEAVCLTPDTNSADEAVLWSAEELKMMGFTPNAHCGCAACAGYATVKENAVRFHEETRAFQDRQRETLPGTEYNESVQAMLMCSQRQQLNTERYEKMTLETFLNAAREVAGLSAIGNYKDDGRGVHGHVESAVVRTDAHEYALDGRALNVSGNQVLATNDDVLVRLARRIAFRFGEKLFLPALHAANTFTNGVHGTILAPGTPTWQVSKAKQRV